MSNAEAQWPATASPFVPARHWSYAVLRRLDDAGLLPRGADVVRRSMPQEEIAGLLKKASEADSSVAAAYLRKFREEFKEPAARGVTLNASLVTEYHRATGRMLAGAGYDTVWTPGAAVKDESDGTARARGEFEAHYLAAAAAVQGARLVEGQLVLSGPWVGGWAGRKDVGYSAGHSGGLVLDPHRFDAVGVYLARPLVIPVIGAVRYEMQLAKVDNVLNLNGSQNRVRPFFWSARGSIEPTSHFRLGINRGMMFGGQGNYPITASRLFDNLLGVYTSKHENAFANQVVGIDFRWRLPTGSLPATLYGAWGADDAAGGWWHTPAIVSGLELLPFRHADALIGIEHTNIARNTRSNSIWYQNAWFRGGWTDAGEVLGHALAGEGREWRVFGEGGAPIQGWSVEAAAYLRNRGSQNLYAPVRAGHSAGGLLRGDVRLGAGTRLEFSGEVEHGTGAQAWTQATLRGGLRARLF